MRRLRAADLVELPARCVLLAALLAGAGGAALAAADAGLRYVSAVGTERVIIDARPLADCRKAALPGARCLPAADFLGLRPALPSERDLLWLFGTAGLDGSETVLVVGDTAGSRDFVAGLLFLCGQHEVRVLDAAVSPLIAWRADAAPGRERGIVRSAVFTAPMRDALWLVDQREARAAAEAIVAPDAYTAIVRFARRVAAGGSPLPVGWSLAQGVGE
jgi:thiosulfate/3-mercaptopyruvate sulfurtransferase